MPTNPWKPKPDVSILPRLIDNKRKHLKGNPSAAQRYQIFMKEMKNDAEFRKHLQMILS